MKLRAKIYKQESTGALQFVGKGACVAYVPVVTKGSAHEPYVSFNFGAYRIHINKEDFSLFCKKFIKSDWRHS